MYLSLQITTVDRYQGQQNDYIILSLVRTKTVGHLRDVRRLIVAMSRARLGLYVFARVSLFQNCFELRPAFSQVNIIIMTFLKKAWLFNQILHYSPRHLFVSLSIDSTTAFPFTQLSLPRAIFPHCLFEFLYQA